MNDFIQPKSTEYGGIVYRSALEAKTAQALDILGIRYEYEPDGIKLSNGIWYKPDFWLPDIHEYIECKGKMEERDAAKIHGLAKDKCFPVIAISYDHISISWADFSQRVTTSSQVSLFQCRCGSFWLMDNGAHYMCRKCGDYDGDRHLMMMEQIESGQHLFEMAQDIAAKNDPGIDEIMNIFNERN